MSIAIRTYDDNKIRIVCNQNPYMTKTRGTNCKEIVRNHKAITPLNFLSENSDEKFSIDNYNRSRLVDLLKIVYDTSTGFDASKIDENKIKKIYTNVEEQSDIVNNKEEILLVDTTFDELLVNLRKVKDEEKGIYTS